MQPDVNSILSSIKHKVAWEEIVEFEKIDERVAVANCIFPNLIGINDGYIECCLSNDPPTLTETLTWWWTVRPDLGAAIASDVPKDIEEAQQLKEAIADYILQVEWRGYT